MGLGERIESILARYRAARMQRLSGPFGDFQRAGGNPRLLEGLDLPAESVVLDVGGFKGDWTADVLCAFGCRSVIFEPIPEFQDALRQRFGKNTRVTLVDAGLAATSRAEIMGVSGSGSGLFAPRTPAMSRTVSLKGVETAWRDLKLERVSCMKINIEGGEYELLDAMAEQGLLDAVDCFLIQFHDVEESSAERRRLTQVALAQTHRKDLDFPFVWERWRHK